MAWLEMTDVRAPCALRLRFILDAPFPFSLGYRLLVTGAAQQEQEDSFSQQGHKGREEKRS